LMEAAVRAGEEAAERVLCHLGGGQTPDERRGASG